MLAQSGKRQGSSWRRCEKCLLESSIKTCLWWQIAAQKSIATGTADVPADASAGVTDCSTLPLWQSPGTQLMPLLTSGSTEGILVLSAHFMDLVNGGGALSQILLYSACSEIFHTLCS